MRAAPSAGLSSPPSWRLLETGRARSHIRRMISGAPAPLETGGLAGVLAAAGAAPGVARGLPPVHLWHPDHCGDIDIRIARDGTWFHDGSPIGRAPLVRLFSTVLRKDPDGFHLVTPVEKLRIQVDDAPFIATRVDRIGETLRFLTNVGDEVDAGSDHPITVGGDAGEPAPYLHVRRGLLARLTRPVFYELVDMAEARVTPAGEALGVWSDGAWFPLGPLETV